MENPIETEFGRTGRHNTDNVGIPTSPALVRSVLVYKVILSLSTVCLALVVVGLACILAGDRGNEEFPALIVAVVVLDIVLGAIGWTAVVTLRLRYLDINMWTHFLVMTIIAVHTVFSQATDTQSAIESAMLVTYHLAHLLAIKSIIKHIRV